MFLKDGDGTVEYEVENKDPRKGCVTLSREMAQTRDNSQRRGKSEQRRARMQKESFKSSLGMFSEAQDNGEEW